MRLDSTEGLEDSCHHVSMGLGTMLFGVSGNCDDKEVTSLADELPTEPDSEKDTLKKERKKETCKNVYDLTN